MTDEEILGLAAITLARKKAKEGGVPFVAAHVTEAFRTGEVYGRAEEGEHERELHQKKCEAEGKLKVLYDRLGVDSFADAKCAINDLIQKSAARDRMMERDREITEAISTICIGLGGTEIVGGWPNVAKRCVELFKRMKSRQLPDGCEWPVDCEDVRIEVGDELEDSCHTYKVESMALMPIVRARTGVLKMACHLPVPTRSSMHHVAFAPTPEPVDSWERWADDELGMDAAEYCAAYGLHDADPITERLYDLVQRARKLAGVDA